MTLYATDEQVLYADDPDVHRVWPITDGLNQPIDFPPVVHVYGHGNITARWSTEAAATRDLDVPLFGLAANIMWKLKLIAPGDNDVPLGFVVLE